MSIINDPNSKCVTTITVGEDAIKALIAQDLGVELNKIKVYFNLRTESDPMDRYSHQVFKNITVEITK